MGNEQSIRDLLNDRDPHYGGSWLTTGKILSMLHLEKILESGLAFSWVMVLNKLIRALTSPRDIDHWKDMAGYATLVTDHLESANEAGHRPVTIVHKGGAKDGTTD